MNSWKTFVFLTGCVIFIVIIIITSQAGGIYCFSFRSGYSWKVDKVKLTVYKQGLKEALKSNPHVLVVLSPNLKKTTLATGYEEKALYYAEWSKLGDWNILTIYLDQNEVQKFPAEKRNRLLTGFIVGETNTFFGLKRDFLTFKESFLQL